MTSNNKISPMKVCYNTNLPFLNSPKDLDLSYKMDLDLWGGFVRKKLCLITEEIRYTFCFTPNFSTIRNILNRILHFHVDCVKFVKS